MDILIPKSAEEPKYMNIACAIIGVPLKISTYAFNIKNIIFINIFLNILSFFSTGMVCTIPTKKPIIQPIIVPTIAIIMVTPAPLKKLKLYSRNINTIRPKKLSGIN